MLPVRRRSERSGYEDGDEILSRAVLLEILEGRHVYILRSYSEILSMSLYGMEWKSLYILMEAQG